MGRASRQDKGRFARFPPQGRLGPVRMPQAMQARHGSRLGQSPRQPAHDRRTMTGIRHHAAHGTAHTRCRPAMHLGRAWQALSTQPALSVPFPTIFVRSPVVRQAPGLCPALTMRCRSIRLAPFSFLLHAATACDAFFFFSCARGEKRGAFYFIVNL